MRHSRRPINSGIPQAIDSRLGYCQMYGPIVRKIKPMIIIAMRINLINILVNRSLIFMYLALPLSLRVK